MVSEGSRGTAGVQESSYTEVGEQGFTQCLPVFISMGLNLIPERGMKTPETRAKTRPLVVSSIGFPCLPRWLVNFGQSNLFIFNSQPRLGNVGPPSYPSLNVDLCLSGL